MFATIYSQPNAGSAYHRSPSETCGQAARDEGSKKYGKIHDGLESSVSLEGRARITRILGEINRLTDVEKLLLYLKLPTGVVPEDQNRLTPTSCLPASNRREQGEAYTWIKSHLEEHGDVCMPKAEVYDEYRQYCEQHELRALCNADFGKMMKQAFPDINTRRLGQRGQSKYFYGGLRKKTEHTPPTLSELEITTKHIEMDSSAMDSEIFKASCALVCEWADKLLESKFSGIQEIAEHLILKTFVNTKSVAAFTLIAAMQESGKQELKGSALFSSQPVAGGDKHRETNLLLQRKLQQNKEIQKQKEKALALREEIQKQKDLQGTSVSKSDLQGTSASKSDLQGTSLTKSDLQGTSSTKSDLQGTSSTKSGSKTPVSSQRKSVTPSALMTSSVTSSFSLMATSVSGQMTSSLDLMTSSVTSSGQFTSASGLMTSSVSTVILPSAKTSTIAAATIKSKEMQFISPKLQTKQSPEKSENETKQTVSPWLQQTFSEGQGQTNFTGSSFRQLEDVSSVTDIKQKVDQSAKENSEIKNSSFSESKNCGAKETKSTCGSKNTSDKDSSSETSVSVVYMKSHEFGDDSDYVLMDTDYQNKKTETQSGICEAKTPELSPEANLTEHTHVRKINFDEMFAQQKDEKSGEQPLPKESKSVPASDKLSKSTGYLSLKKMLESKSDKHSGLNKSMGYLEKTNNALFVSPSTISGRSAFVPFSQVQSLIRKDTNVNQPVAMAIPVIIPSAAQAQSSQTVSQSTNFAMIALPANLETSPVKQSQSGNSSDAIFSIVPASAVFKSPNIPSNTETTGQMLQTSLNSSNQCKESLSVVTVSSVLSKMAQNECTVSASVNAQNMQKQLRTKFTPIRPKASPNKSQPPKETKSEGTGYDKDKRPVSAILKEKRAKEQADAIAKIQSSHHLPATPFQSNIPLTGNQLGSLQGMQSGSSFQGIQPGTNIQGLQTGLNNADNVTASSNEVVIIVNNQQVQLQHVIDQNIFSAEAPVSVSSSTSQDLSNTPSSKSDSNKDQRHQGYDAEKDGEVTEGYSKMENSEKTENISSVESSSKDLGSVSSELNDFSPMSLDRDITPILLDDEDDTPTLTEADARSLSNLKDFFQNEGNKGGKGQIGEVPTEDMVEQMWMETPRKIQKLNITSPFQEETAYNLGRETPVRISKPSDSCLSRPESACSYGRETPSGARKRKSSDLQPRKDFKRLNSTGEETDDLHNLSYVLSPESDLNPSLNPRRTQSCTFELDRDSRSKTNYLHHQLQHGPKSGVENLVQGLQSPDIHSLEREALIESFPNSLYAMKPQHKLHKNQSSSTGVSVKSLRQSQQRLKKQQQVLDERMKNFLQTQTETSQETESDIWEPVSESTREPVSELTNQQTASQTSQKGSNVTLETLVVSDRGKPYQRPSSVATMGSKSLTLEIEPSGLPSDVADWINETIEKRQNENQSVLSEPDFRDSQSIKLMTKDSNSKFRSFRFEMDNEVSMGSQTGSVFASQINPKYKNEEKSLPQTESRQDDNNFTVPKAPPLLNPRSRDTLRLNTDLMSANQRCHSLPIFASPVHSPVSPMAPPVNRNYGNQRASSMSPRTQITEQTKELLSPTGRQNFSPVKRKDGRETQASSPGHPAIYTGTNHRPDSKQGSYLASIQHSLQKPVDTSPDMLDGAYSKVASAPVNLTGKLHTMLQQKSRESSLDSDERFVSKTPFSDSGYHSSGPSPILNSTPVSTLDSSDLSTGQGHVSFKHSVAESPIIMVTNLTNQVSSMEENQHTNRTDWSRNAQNVSGYSQNVPMLTEQAINYGANSNQLRSSIHSAFIPIQGSHHDVRYVAPIKPTVTVPSNMEDEIAFSARTGNFSDLFIDAGQQVIGSDVTVVSPKSGDPPSYEVAIQQLKMATSPQSGGISHNQSTQEVPNTGNLMNQSSLYGKKMSLLPNMENEEMADSLGPFAQKLMELSQQTQSGGRDIQSLLRTSEGTVYTSMSEAKQNNQSPFLSVQSDLSNLRPSFSESQSILTNSSSYIGDNGANDEFVRDLTLSTNDQSGNTLFIQRPSDYGLNQKSAIKNVLLPNMPHSVASQNKLSDNPSFHLSHHQLTNQNAAQTVMSSFHHYDSSNLNSESESSQFMNKSDFFMPASLGTGQQYHITNSELAIFSDNGAFQKLENTNSVKNILPDEKVQDQDFDITGDDRKGKSDITGQHELMEDIGLSWESLREIEGDLGDFNMFN